MSFYTIGFIIAAILYFVHNMQKGKEVTKYNVILAILTGLLSWIGVVMMLLFMSFKERNK